jgi:hypothetical protein
VTALPHAGLCTATPTAPTLQATGTTRGLPTPAEAGQAVGAAVHRDHVTCGLLEDGKGLLMPLPVVFAAGRLSCSAMTRSA